MPIISAEDREKLARPHIMRAWFGVFDFPDQVLRLHSGEGSKVVDGYEWIGVADVLGGRLVYISEFEEPRFGQAAAVDIVLSGASREFIQSVHATRAEIEGRPASISWAAFDGETEEQITQLIPLFPRGRMSSPKIIYQGVGQRYVSLTIESLWSSKNYAPGGRWNPADQRRRYPGDKGLDFVNVKVSENWPS